MTLPSYSRSRAINKCLFHSLLNTRVFVLFVDFTVQNAPKCSADLLSSIPLHKKATDVLEKIHVLIFVEAQYI